MTVMLEARGLSKRFGSLLAVDGLDLEVERGEVLGFLGPNGSGKSTTMRMLTGFLTPSGGSAKVCGIDVQADPVAAQRHLGYLPEGAPAYADMTPSSYLRFVAEAHGLRAAAAGAAIERAIVMTQLEPVRHRPIETLSKGYKRRVGLAHALVHDPDVLVLDEPTDGLDPNQKHEVRALIQRIAADKAIIVSTHILEEVEAICTRTLIIAAGRRVTDGTPRELRALSPYHNAVTVTLPTVAAAAAEQVLRGVEGVDHTERGPTLEGLVCITAIAAPGHDIRATGASAVRAADLPFEQIHNAPVHLDDVFRQLTQVARTSTGDAEQSLAVTAAPSVTLPVSPIPGASTRGMLGRDLWTICRRELAGYFTTPLAYVFIVIFLAALSALTFFAGGFFEVGQANLDGFFAYHPWLYLLLVPAIAMRLWAEERKTGSIELLLTLPLSTAAAVLGKFTAAWIVIAAGLALSSSLWVTVNYLGTPDNGAIATAYAGSLLLAGAYLAIGGLASVLTRSQVIAFIVAAALCFVFTVSGLRVVLDAVSGWAPVTLTRALSGFSFLEHYRGLTRGVVDIRDLVFFASTTALFLFATVVLVERKKAG